MWASNGLERLGCEVDGMVVLVVVVLVVVVMAVLVVVLLVVVVIVKEVNVELTSNYVMFQWVLKDVISK